MPLAVKNLTAFKTEADPTHFESIPHPREVVRCGGLPGVEYCYVLGKNIGKFQRATKEEAKENQWSLTRNIPVISIIGPKGLADSVVVMSRGVPIPGSDPENGSRRWYVDNELLAVTGHKPATFEEKVSAEDKPSEATGNARKASGQGRESDGRVQTGNTQV